MAEPKATARSRAILLGVLVVILAGLMAYTWWPAASPAQGPSNQARDQRRPGAATAAPAGPLNVRLEDLKQPPPEPGGENRNPFRFYVKPPPPPPPIPTRTATQGTVSQPPTPTGPPPPPPMPIKFIGTAEQGKKKVAIFSDGRGVSMFAAEGELVAGQYRVVRIGVESVVMEYPNGTGRQTIPMRGGQ